MDASGMRLAIGSRGEFANGEPHAVFGTHDIYALRATRCCAQGKAYDQEKLKA